MEEVIRIKQNDKVFHILDIIKIKTVPFCLFLRFSSSNPTLEQLLPVDDKSDQNSYFFNVFSCFFLFLEF